MAKVQLWFHTYLSVCHSQDTASQYSFDMQLKHRHAIEALTWIAH
jgi:hypothetical protein